MGRPAFAAAVLGSESPGALTDIPFSRLSPSILDHEPRLRVARQILAVLEDHLGVKGLSGRCVLDVGCSSGIITSFLADAGASIAGSTSTAKQ